jgi:AraC family transcriptional regulator
MGWIWTRIAEIACMSSYHWHRIYRAIHGETLAATVKRLRLHRAAGDIVRTGLAVSDIARRSGYPNLQSFNRIFKSVYGMPPARYRKEGSHTDLRTLTQRKDQGHVQRYLTEDRCRSR